MRILLTTDTIGGVWTFTKELTTELLEREHSVALVSVGRAPSADQAAWCSRLRADFGSDFRYEVSLASLEWMPANDNAYTEAEPILLRVAEEFAPELLHANQFCFGRLPIAIPHVITAHSDVLSWADACRPGGLESSDWLRRYRALVQQGLDAADAVVAPTRWMLDALRRHFEISCASRVILNGRSMPAGEQNNRRAMQAVSAGRVWDEAKNISMLADVRSPIPIFVAGASRQDGAAAPMLAAGVKLLGYLDEHELLALFRTSSIYLATSIYEPFGLAPLEAALCGCAVLASGIPSFREVWGDAARYFDSADALDRLLTQLHGSPALLEQLQHKSKRRALELTRSRMVDSYVMLYEEVLSSPQQTPAHGLATYA